MNKITILFLISIFAISSCSYFAYERLMNIERGMDKTDLVNVMESDEYSNDDVTLINDSESDMHDISNEVNGSEKISVLICNKYQILQDGSETPYYIFAFENEKLLYWGLPLEFGRNKNKKIQQIGDAAQKIIKEKYLES